MRIAVITGASSGIGKEFVRQISSHGNYDEIWAIARSKEKLEALQAETTLPVRPVVLDLSKEQSFSAYADLLKQASPQIGILVNCSGFGKFAATTDISAEECSNMIDLNCKAVLALALHSLPYMPRGSEMVNVASVAAFQPIPFIGVYAATKSFVLSFSRALNREQKARGVKIAALCPFWTKTAFFDRAITKTDARQEPVVKYYAAMYEPEKIVRRALRDVARGKDVSQYGFIARTQAILCKILPHSLIMSVWMRQQKLKPKK